MYNSSQTASHPVTPYPNPRPLFCKSPAKETYILQNRPIFLRNLPIVADP